MEKQQTNLLINQLELVKSLITQAQGNLEDGNLGTAEEELVSASNLLVQVKKDVTGGNPNISTERM